MVSESHILNQSFQQTNLHQKKAYQIWFRTESNQTWCSVLGAKAPLRPLQFIKRKSFKIEGCYCIFKNTVYIVRNSNKLYAKGQGGFKFVSWVFEGGFKGDSWVFQWCFMGIFSTFQGCWHMLNGCLMNVLKVCLVSRLFLWIFFLVFKGVMMLV